ncbi:hypothetical protein ACQPZF_11420 [Actinosynnema sp. CS-041913]|uniref:hypothetical protein n=1 Tax=Actinosynnema sp. CS-041913 TaxID=3239917 RepID=UPI003D89B505
MLSNGGALLVVRFGSSVSTGLPLGRSGAVGLLFVGIVVTVLAAVATFAARRLPRAVLVVAAVVEAIAAGAVAVLGIAWLTDALVILLLGAFAMVNVAVGLPGAGAPAGRSTQ